MLRIEEDGGIAVVRIDRPEARNALNAETLSALTDTARTLGRRSDISAVILTGTDSFFSAGIDLKAEPRASATLLERRDAARAGPDLCRAWEAIEAVTIVAIEGYCVGGACALALACDFRIMAAGAMMRLPEVPLGMNMSWGTLPRLVALIGPARAKAFALFGEPAHVSECLAWGLADRSAEQGEALTEARQWAERVAALPGFADIHPLQPEAQAQGLLGLMHELERELCAITGMDAFTLQPAAGAAGELTGLKMIAAYHRRKKRTRKTILIPDSAHGTNPASAALSGFSVVQLSSGPDGLIDLEDLKKKDGKALVQDRRKKFLGMGSKGLAA